MIKEIISDVKTSGRNSLNEYQASQIMNSTGISMAKSIVCKNFEELISTEENIEYPVVLKILSSDILHKTDAGCVEIGINNKEDLIKAYAKVMDNARKYNPNASIDGILVQEMVKQGLELIIGMKKDPQFGPVVMFGLGGIYVEVFQDISLRLLPIDNYEAVEMIKETKIYKIIDGAREKEYDLDAVVDTLLKISKLVEENEEIEEIDLNPFFLYEKGEGGKAVDALISLN
jgi:acetate---CoA ligase (ADP-forming) subunit beta